MWVLALASTSSLTSCSCEGLKLDLSSSSMARSIAAAEVAQLNNAHNRVAATQEAQQARHVEQIVALQEQRAMRQREMVTVRQAGLSESYGEAFGAALRQRKAQLSVAAARDRFSPYDSALADHPLGLAKEAALREQMRRRMMEEEAIRNRHE